jgi:cytochrome c
MNLNRRLLIAAAAAATVFCAPVFAQDRGNKEEAKALCEAAAAHLKKVGFEQATKDFRADKAKWMPKDLYPFVMDSAGVMRFHISDKMVDKNVLGLKDASGKEFSKEILSVAKSKGTGWVDYEWSHPVTKKVEDKSSYVQSVTGTDYVVGVGVYR